MGKEKEVVKEVKDNLIVMSDVFTKQDKKTANEIKTTNTRFNDEVNFKLKSTPKTPTSDNTAEKISHTAYVKCSAIKGKIKDNLGIDIEGYIKSKKDAVEKHISQKGMGNFLKGYAKDNYKQFKVKA